MEKALSIAKYVLAKFAAKGELLTNLKLQKMLYYVQAWHLAANGKPLFSDPIEAWVHGPVVSNVFGTFKQFRWSPINGTFDDSGLRFAVREHIDRVIDAYGHLSAAELEDLTHSEKPWRWARGRLAPDAPSREHIRHDHMRDFYRSIANG